MKIIYTTNVRLPTEKAHGLQIMKSCEAFAQQGIDLELVVPSLRPKIQIDPFEYYRVRNNFSLKKVFVLEVLPFQKWVGSWVGYIQNLSFSLRAAIYTSNNYEPGTILYSRDNMTLLVLSFLNLPFVAELHDYRSRKRKWSVSRVVNKATKLVLNSRGTLKALEQHYDIDKNKTLISPNGVDVDFFKITDSKEETRRKLSMNNKFTIGYIGRLETVGREKGVSHILQEFKTLSGCELYIVGGPDRLVEKYKKEVGVLGIDPALVHFTGQVEYNRVPLYMKAMDAVIIPAPSGLHAMTTSPIKLFASMAAHKTIIAADLDSFKEYLNVDNSLLFDHRKNGSLTAQVNFAMNNKDRAVKLADKALSDAYQYSWTLRAEKIIKFIYA